jgi:threonine dehydratase
MSSAAHVEPAAPSWKAILAAHARIAPHIHRTPVLTSDSFNAMTGAQLFFKCDNFQKTGSFKIRGASNTIFSLSDQEIAHGIVTQSSGNHGAAVACAAAWRGVPAYIVMPRNAPKVKVQAIESYGGKVTFCEPKVSARKETCDRLQAETGAILVHPYDDDRIIAGQATAAKELLEEVPDLDAVFAPVSGGGLLSGTCLGARGLSPTTLTAPWPRAPCNRLNRATPSPTASVLRSLPARSRFSAATSTASCWSPRRKLSPPPAWSGNA